MRPGSAGGRELCREGAISNCGTTSRHHAGRRKRLLRAWRHTRGHGCLISGLAVITATLIHSQPANAQDQSSLIRDSYGEIGILDMPSAHMADDGQLAFTVGDIGEQQRYSLSFQALPWLATSFRFTHLVGQSLGIDYHRNFALTARLFREGTYTPDISIGIRNLIGTGRDDSEFIAASKHIGTLDLTAGLGWGEMAGNGTLPNPFGYVFSSFKTRKPPGSTGVVDFGEFFHGPRAGVFGGATWQTPIDGLSLLAEYSSDLYTDYIYPGRVKVRSPVNLGLSYRPSSALALTAGWLYGTTYGFTVSFSGDATKSAGSESRIGPAVPPAVVRSSTEQQRALTQMLDRNSYLAAARSGGPWVHVPTETEHAKQDLEQALLSESRGVRDIDIEGTTLTIDANNSSDSQAQCARYAEIASSVGTRVTSVAMTDLQSADGTVIFCPVAARAKYAQNNAPSGLGSNGTVAKEINEVAFERTLRADMGKQSLYLDALSLGTSELWVYYDNSHYETESQAAGRIVRVLMADAPPSIEIFHLIPTANGIPRQEITMARSALERTVLAHGTASELGSAIALSAPPLDNPALDRAAGSIYPYFYWSLDPKLTEHVFDPNKPLQFMVYADGAAGVVLAPGLTIGTDLTANVWNDYTFDRPAGSDLPHVRSDLLQYVKQGANGISSLQATYETRLARDVFAKLKAGYLEDMFMGAGGEVLWRPEDSSIAIGADLYQVWKRDFNRLFGIQNYNILTGHVSIYYQSPWYGLNFNVHVGRYLAGDRGATFEVTRRFASGVEVGAWTTFTNVPFSKFGEGSFDKGIIVHIPFEWGLPLFSQSSYDLHLAALTRDGGQRLSDDDSLYDQTRRTSYDEIKEHFDDLVEP